ncbi:MULTISPECIES: SH3 domain-containing protein [unclassified Saccharopolyspora]|uniref:SH3 domain-containing protein n=1 Tax=Saccharopolyspora TaxID=1835 RepID=UPI00190BB5FC|nr:SH3 domain-containing protein [Saccharopolyspora sp. HNM0986]MBK0866415.1 SH3 domain-containing protein [Saccharopolyspora sp. HNM0986]
MHAIRNAVLAAVATLVLPMNGVASGVAHFVFEFGERLGELSRAADRTGDFRVPGVNLRAAPDTASAVLGLGNAGDRVRKNRQAEGEPVTCPGGRPDRTWWHVLDRHTRVAGWVSACYL